jgi:predicted nuclease of predicted toxin-antitoxin system
MKLLVDMNLSPRWVDTLRDAGWDAVHWSSIGRGNEPDAEIMRYAAQNGYTVLTHDLDFSAILAATHGDRPSVVQVRTDDVSPKVVSAAVIAALRRAEPELEAGALLTVSSGQMRIRMLPIVSA